MWTKPGKKQYFCWLKGSCRLTNKLRKITFFSGNLNVRTEIQDSVKWLEEKMIDSLMTMLSFLSVLFFGFLKVWRILCICLKIN